MDGATEFKLHLELCAYFILLLNIKKQFVFPSKVDLDFFSVAHGATNCVGTVRKSLAIGRYQPLHWRER
jgi:hypothetical protein